ncbi:NAD(P)H-nitrite reductase [Sphaerochaeta pleomorpha str. Grapes]|uniref:NAD(P)H-nitrite reductase n=1 Tax=Sphaerochaeta pleomorpha (strain ATCC BAA-1885 / DSM 22778 / Grapes) TaxID=158190 RepID=G8QY42_SPHPG|nr:FAD-dependent oxidoreductase [Sphaerochaeta pleomorpha]AEV29607.1 NAD(P)H-nitrite reductase [Sphaerochaeta pleomorpha str. Grapes]
MNYVIIGNSIASVGCIESIRKIDEAGTITVIGDEAHQCYSRPLISYLLEGKTTKEKMVYRSPEFYEQNQVKLVLGKKATRIDSGEKHVILEDGATYPYDKLLVATGSCPFVPPMKNLEAVKNRFSFMKLDDANELEKSIAKDSRVLIIGAGLIGLKCAEGIYNRVKSITVVDLAKRVLPSILDEEGSSLVEKHLHEKGITCILGDSVSEFQDNDALLKSGTVVGFDIVVLAVGVRPNVSLVKDAGGATNRAILIDEQCKTSLEDIYSAGDCTEGVDFVSGERKVLAILPNAYMQGEIAGKNMAGESASFDKGMAMNAIGFFGLHIITAGSYIGEAIVIRSKAGYKRLFIQNGHLVGYILIGDMIDRAGIYTSLVRNKTDLSTIDFELISEQPMLMAFAKKDRVQKLGDAQ